MTVFALPALTVANRVFVGLGMEAIKVDSRTDLIYVGRQGEARLQVFDPASYLPVDYVEVPGDVSYMAIDDANDALFLVVPSRRSVAVVELTSWKLLASFDVGDEPYQVVLVGERR
jgi:hypothetical protein